MIDGKNGIAIASGQPDIEEVGFVSFLIIYSILDARTSNKTKTIISESVFLSVYLEGDFSRHGIWQDILKPVDEFMILIFEHCVHVLDENTGIESSLLKDT